MKKYIYYLENFLYYTRRNWNTIVILLFILLLLWLSMGISGYFYAKNYCTDANTISNVSINTFGGIICLLFYISCLNERNDASIDMIFFGVLDYMETSLLSFDTVSRLCIGNAKLLPMSYVSHFIVAITPIVMLFFFWAYVKYSLDQIDTYPLLDDIVTFTTSFLVVLLIINLKFPIFYHFNSEGKLISDHYQLLYVIGFLLLAAIGIYILKNESNSIIRKRLLWYTTIPLIVIGVRLCGIKETGLNTTILCTLILCFNNVYHQRGIDLVKQHEELIQQSHKMLEYQTDIMISEIQPHFLYNSLGAIHMLIDIDPAKASEATKRFSKYLRGNLDSLKNKDLIPFSKELEHVENYLYLEKMRFDDIEIQVNDIEETTFLLPPLTIQPLVENAIKHGLMGKEEGGKIIIREKEFELYHQIEICDDGIGFDIHTQEKDGHSHIGIMNVKNRLDELVNGTIEIDSKIGKGTAVIIKIPK